MTARTLEAWAAAVQAATTGLIGPATLSGTVQVDVTGGPDGDVSVHAVLDGGQVTAIGAGAATDPDAVLTLTAADAGAVVAGTLDPSVAFMRGRLKVAGEMGVVLDLLALASTAAARECRDRVAAGQPD